VGEKYKEREGNVKNRIEEEREREDLKKKTEEKVWEEVR